MEILSCKFPTAKLLGRINTFLSPPQCAAILTKLFCFHELPVFQIYYSYFNERSQFCRKRHLFCFLFVLQSSPALTICNLSSRSFFCFLIDKSSSLCLPVIKIKINNYFSREECENSFTLIFIKLVFCVLIFSDSDNPCVTIMARK